MRLEEIMTTPVRIICPDATVQEAARLMDDENVGALPVCDGDRVIGIVTDRDIVVRSTSAGQAPMKTTVRDVMTAPVSYCFIDQTVDEVALIMKRACVRRLPVLDRVHRLVGMIAVDDLVAEVSERAGVDVLQSISEVERPGL